jgi:hypothetical protein
MHHVYPKRVSDNLAKDLISCLLTNDPFIRLGGMSGAKEVMDHSYFNSIKWDMIEKRLLKPPTFFRKAASTLSIGETGSHFGPVVASGSAEEVGDGVGVLDNSLVGRPVVNSDENIDESDTRFANF